MNNRNSSTGGDLVLFSCVLSVMLLLVVGYAWMPDQKVVYESGAPEKRSGVRLSEWFSRPPLARYAPSEDPRSESAGDVEWESEDVEIDYRDYPDENYKGTFRVASFDASDPMQDDSVFDPFAEASDTSDPDSLPSLDTAIDQSLLADDQLESENPQDSSILEDGDSRKIPRLFDAPVSGSDNGADGLLAQTLPDLPPIEQVDPVWWTAEMQMPLLVDRSPVFASLDEIICVAMQKSPRVQMLNSQTSIQQAAVCDRRSFDWNAFIETHWNASSVQQDTRMALDFRQTKRSALGSQSSQSVLAHLELQRTSDRTLQERQRFVVEVVDGYWKVYQCRATLAQNRRSMTRASELRDRLSKRSADVSMKDKLMRAEAAVAARHSDVIRSEFELINAQDRLINFTVGPNSQGADAIELLTEPMMFAGAIDIPTSLMADLAIRNRPEVTQAITDIKAAAIQQKIAAGSLLLQLGSVLQRGSQPESARSARTRLQTNAFQQQFEQVVGDVVLEARIATRNLERLNLETANDTIALQKAADELALIHQRLDADLAGGRAGSFSVENLLASQMRLTAAERRMVGNQTAQALAMIELKRVTGQLLRCGDQTVLLGQAAMIPVEVICEPVPVQPATYRQSEGFRWSRHFGR